MRGFAVQSFTNPDIGFAIYVKNDDDYDKAVELAYAGLFAWLGDDEKREEYFLEYGVDSYYWGCGYFEPAEELLTENGIEYEIKECFDDEGNWLDNFDVNSIENVY